jgi:hypothetical protein
VIRMGIHKRASKPAYPSPDVRILLVVDDLRMVFRVALVKVIWLCNSYPV